MKIIVGNHITQNNICFWAFDDDKTLIPEENMTSVGDPLEFVIGDLGTSNSIIYENITDVPEDFVTCKYFYDGTTWTANEDYNSPEECQELWDAQAAAAKAEMEAQLEAESTAEAERYAARAEEIAAEQSAE